MATPQFLPIATGSMDIQAIIPTGDDLSDNIAIAKLDTFGYTAATYVWNDWACEMPCWVNDDLEAAVANVAAGEGLWIQASSDTQSIQSAGKVGDADVVVQLKSGNTATGNPFPVALPIQDIVPEGDDLSDNISIVTLDEFGLTAATYVWNDWACETPCWVDDEFEAATAEFAPGAGLWVQASSDSQSLRYPAPEL